MRNKKQTPNRSIRKYALLPIIVTLLFFYSAFPIKAQPKNENIVNIQDTLAMKESDEIFVDGVAMPQFYGGDKELLKWLLNNIRYPDEAVKNKIEGRVILRFVIKSDGSIDDITVVKSLDPACDQEAIRVVKMMPNWIPGKQDGNPVDTYYTLPVLFVLPKVTEENTSEIIETPDSTVVLPQYPGGDKALMKFLVSNMQYPIEAARNNIQGRVIVSFLVMTDGSITDVKIIQSVHLLLDKEAIRIVKRMPKWIPGTRDSEPVNFYYSLPITFRLSPNYIRIEKW